MNNEHDMFNGLGGAQTFDRGNFLNPGTYNIMVNRAIAKDTRESGLAVIVEMTLMSSEFRPQADPQNQGRVWQPSPAKMLGTWFQSMTKKDVALPALKSFVRAVLGLKNDDPLCQELDAPIPGSRRCVIDSLMLMVTGEQNVFQSMYVHLECQMIRTKEGTDFTRYDFSALDFATIGVPRPDVRSFIERARTGPTNGVQFAPVYTPPVSHGFFPGTQPGFPPHPGPQPGPLPFAGSFPFAAVPVPPVPAPVQSMPLSPDGRYAWDGYKWIPNTR